MVRPFLRAGLERMFFTGPNRIPKLIFKSTMDTLVDYTNSLLDTYRSLTHDAIMIYGFIPDNASTATLKARFKIQDGIRLVIG
mgnify:CR=1 FL=1